MAWGAAIASLTSQISGVRLVVDELGLEAARLPRSASFFARREVVLASLIVIISGYFESFLRGFAEEFTSELSVKNVPFSGLPFKIQQTHFGVGGKVLTEAGKTKPRPHVKAPQSDIARRLASVNSPGYSLLWEAFAETQANPGSDAVRDYLSAMSIKDGFAEISAELSAKEPHNPQNAMALRLSLDALIARRNECAHTGASALLLDEVTLGGYCDLVERIARGISHAVDKVVQAA